MPTAKLSLAATLLPILLALGPVLGAEEPKAGGADPRARQLLDDVIRAYAALDSYADSGEFRLSGTVGGEAHSEVLPLKLAFRRPNQLDFTAGPVHIVSDGKTLTTLVEPLRAYEQVPAPKRVSLETLRRGPGGSVVFGGPAGPAVEILWGLLTETDPLRGFADLGGRMVLEDDREQGGSKLRSLRIERGPAPDVRLLIDPQTKLLRRIDWLLDADKPETILPKGRRVAFEHFGWSAGEVSTKAPDDRRFALELPKGFTKVEAKAAPDEAESAQFPIMELLGKPAPDFTLTLLDGPDKTRTVAKPDLAGKVVVINFWATWCAPCIAELPDVQKMIESYAEGKKGVVIVSLSQDRRPGELADIRKHVETKLETEKARISGSPVGQIGLDPSGSVGEAFQVTALPTVVILDAKGIVRAAHVGSTPRETLTKEIDTLLEGKPLGKPEPAPDQNAADGEEGRR